MKSKIFKILLCLCVVWIVVTAYFYQQHRITLQRHVINEKIELKEATLVIDELVLKNRVERITSFDNWRFKIATKVPRVIQMPLYQILNFYSKPYQKMKNNDKNQFNILEMRGHIIKAKGTVPFAFL